MNKGVRLKEDMVLASALRKKLEQWLTESNPAFVKQLEKNITTSNRQQQNEGRREASFVFI